MNTDYVRSIARLILALGLVGTACYMAVVGAEVNGVKDMALVALTFYFAKDQV